MFYYLKKVHTFWAFSLEHFLKNIIQICLCACWANLGLQKLESTVSVTKSRLPNLSLKLGFLTCGMWHALCIMRNAVRYAACVIPLIRNAAIFSPFSC